MISIFLIKKLRPREMKLLGRVTQPARTELGHQIGLIRSTLLSFNCVSLTLHQLLDQGSVIKHTDPWVLF